MKKMIFILLIAMSFTSAIAKTTEVQEPNKVVSQVNAPLDIFKVQQKPSFLNKAGGRMCRMECFQVYRACLRNGGTACESTMEQCTNNCEGGL